MDKANAVNALLRNGAKIDDKSKINAKVRKYEKTLSDEVLRRVGISDLYKINVFTSYIN